MRFVESCNESVMRLLRHHYSTLIKTLQDARQQNSTALLSRNYSTPIKTPTAQRLLQNYRKHISKMIGYLNSILLCTLLGAVTCYSYYLMKTLLKIAEESFIDLLPKSNLNRQKLIECVLIRNSKKYLGKVYTEE